MQLDGILQAATDGQIADPAMRQLTELTEDWPLPKMGREHIVESDCESRCQTSKRSKAKQSNSESGAFIPLLVNQVKTHLLGKSMHLCSSKVENTWLCRVRRNKKCVFVLSTDRTLAELKAKPTARS